MNITRRNFFVGMLAACAAPAVVRADNIMKVFVPPQRNIILWGDGIHADELALSKWFSGESVTWPTGAPVTDFISDREFFIGDTIHIPEGSQYKSMRRCVVHYPSHNGKYFLYVDGRTSHIDVSYNSFLL